MGWIRRKKIVVGVLGFLAAGWLVMAANAEDRPGKTVTKSHDWPVKFTVKVQETKPTAAQQKTELKQPFYPALTKREQQILTALDADTKCNFPDVPLYEALQSLQAQHGVNIYLDAQALKENGLTVNMHVNVSLSGISLKSALNIILNPLGLDYVIDNEVLKITTQEKVNRMFRVRIYPVADLCDSAEDYQALENVIQNTCLRNGKSKHYPVDDLVFGAPGKKKVVLKNGSASMSAVPQCGALVINDTDRVHEKIVELFTLLRQVRNDQAALSSETK